MKKANKFFLISSIVVFAVFALCEVIYFLNVHDDSWGDIFFIAISCFVGIPFLLSILAILNFVRYKSLREYSRVTSILEIIKLICATINCLTAVPVLLFFFGVDLGNLEGIVDKIGIGMALYSGIAMALIWLAEFVTYVITKIIKLVKAKKQLNN